MGRSGKRVGVDRLLLRLAALAVSAAAAACATPPRTTPLTGDRSMDYVAPDDGDPDPATLFIVTASGGGQRAAALTLGTLQALDEVVLPGGRTMLDEVDVISSVSGGSVTAAYYALRGRAGFETLEQSFLRQSGNAALLANGLDPVNLAQLVGPGYTRLDWVIDYLRDALFGDATYADLAGRRPYLIVNAADMSKGTTFAFTQPWFDLICADLSAFRLADAVAASAAVPMAFAPLAVRDNAPCPQQDIGEGDAPTLPAWAGWVADGLDFDRHRSIERLQRARTALAYLNLDCTADGACSPLPADRRTAWIHLLDGGIVDNLGLSEPLRLISTQEVAPFYLPEIVSGRITRIVVVVVSARVEQDFGIDQSGAAPGLFTMLTATISSPINAASLSLVSRLKAMIDQGAADYRAELSNNGRSVEKDGEERTPALAVGAPDLDRFGLVIDFELIDGAACRDRFKAIPTSWTIDPRETGALIRIAGPLLAANPDFARLVADLGGHMPAYERIADTCARLVH
ncbi:MAG: patatin-like phospholipase family protein [Alphaproteobacteria bacterium]